MWERELRNEFEREREIGEMGEEKRGERRGTIRVAVERERTLIV